MWVLRQMTRMKQVIVAVIHSNIRALSALVPCTPCICIFEAVRRFCSCDFVSVRGCSPLAPRTWNHEPTRNHTNKERTRKRRLRLLGGYCFKAGTTEYTEKN